MSQPDLTATAILATMLESGYLPIDCFVKIERLRARANPRTAEEIRELADSIADRGQQTAVEFQLHEGQIILTKGFGRLEAMELLLSENRLWPGGPGVKAVLSDRNGEWEEVLRESYIDALHENIHRHNPKPADIVKAIEELAAEPYNMNDQEIARRLRVSGGYISQHRSYSQLIPEVRKEVEAGRLSFRGTRQFFGRPPAWQQKKLKQLESKADHRNKLPAGGDKPARRRKKKAAQGRRRAATPAPQTTATSALDQFRIAGRGPLSKFLQHVHDFLTGGMTTAQWISCREAARPLLATVSRPKGDPSPRPAKRPATTHKDASIVHELHPDPAVLPGKATEKKRRTLKSPAAAVLTSRRSVKTHR